MVENERPVYLLRAAVYRIWYLAHHFNVTTSGITMWKSHQIRGKTSQIRSPSHAHIALPHTSHATWHLPAVIAQGEFINVSYSVEDSTLFRYSSFPFLSWLWRDMQKRAFSGSRARFVSALSDFYGWADYALSSLTMFRRSLRSLHHSTPHRYCI